MIDPISDMLTRIRNAQRAGHKQVEIPASKLKLAIAKILKEENFIERVEKVKNGKFDSIKLTLKYDERKNPVINTITRVSKEGQRIYMKKDEIRKTKNGFGISIVSTSKGVLTGEKARTEGVGGEVICELW